MDLVQIDGIEKGMRRSGFTVTRIVMMMRRMKRRRAVRVEENPRL